MITAHPTDFTLSRVQLVRKAALLAAVAASVAFLIFGESSWPGDGVIHETVEWVGIFLIVFCIVGRTWSSIYIAGRKIRTLVTDGPYSISRNPLYVFSVIGAAGAGAQLGSAVLALAAGFVAWLVFYLVVRKEERALTAKLGLPYRQYLATVPRFLPKWSLWRDTEKVEVRPHLIARTFLDACVFLLSIPLAEGFEYLHEAGLLPVIATLP
jgi:protein-S-isoprenylcysteine O-methyltransferase Ste14